MNHSIPLCSSACAIVVRSVGIPILEKELSDMKIPDIDGKAKSPIGKIDYSLKE